MALDVEVSQENPCCVLWKKKHSKLMERSSKLEDLKNKFKECTNLVQQKYNAIEKENEGFREAMKQLEEQVNRWKYEKEKESALHTDLKDEVSALKDEIRLLKQGGNSASQQADKLLQGRLDAAEGDIQRMNGLLVKEREKADSEKMNAELERKKADAILKKVQMEKNNSGRALAEVHLERTMAGKDNHLLEKLKSEMDALKSMLDSERSKYKSAEKELEIEKRKFIREKRKAESAVDKAVEQRKNAEARLKTAEESKFLCEKLKIEVGGVKSMLTSERSKFEAAEKKVEAEKQKSTREKKRADLAVAKAKEQHELAETNLKKAKIEKDRADKFYQELEEERSRAKEIDRELRELKCRGKLAEVDVDPSITRKIAEVTKNDVCPEMVKSDVSQWVKLLLEKEQEIIRERNRTDSAKKKAKREKKVAENYKKMAREEKHRAENLSKGLEGYKLKFKELWEELQELLTYQRNAKSPRNCIDIISNSDTVNLLKKQLKLEKMLTKVAQKATNVEVVRNSILSHELCHLKKDVASFQQRLDILDDSGILHDGEGIMESEKMKNQTFTQEKFSADRHRGQLTSGIDSRLDSPCSGFKRKFSLSSAINSSSTSFCDRSLVGSSPGRGNLSEMTSAELREDVSRLVQCNKNAMFYSKGPKLQRSVPTQLLLCNDQKDEAAENNLPGSSSEKLIGPSKKRKVSCQGTVIPKPSHESGQQIVWSIDDVDACMQVSPPSVDGTKFDQRPRDCRANIETHSYMKLLDLYNPAEEESYRRAIEAPLSPTLPEIELNWDDSLEADHFTMLVDGSFQEGPSDANHTLPPNSSSNNLNFEKNTTNLLPDNLVSSELQMEKDYTDLSKNAPLEKPSNISCHQVQVPGEKLGVSDISGSKNEERSELCARKVYDTAVSPLKNIIISSDNKNVHSISRILLTVNSCIPQCALLHTVDTFLQNLLSTVSSSGDLSKKERSSVFFTIILSKISEVTIPEISSALSQLALRNKFTEALDFPELLVLIEDFLLQKKVFVSPDRECNHLQLSELEASSHQVIAASSLLASLCSVFDHIGFLCETSCNIFITQKFDPEVVLAVLHAFANTCGSKYFSLKPYNLSMIVVKSLVVRLEKQMTPSSSKILKCCSSCPFSENVLPIQDVVSMLLKNLRMYGQSVDSHDESVLRFTDTLSLLEMLATVMGWDWTNDNIICQCWELLECCDSEGFVASIIILLGQFGRIGVDARGYDHLGIKKLRELFSAFLSRSTFSKSSFSVQTATVSALLGVTPIKFEDIIIETRDNTIQSVDAKFIRKWFSLLNEEQQSVFRVELAAM